MAVKFATYLVESERLFREGLKGLFSDTCFSVCGEAERLTDALAALKAGDAPALVLFDFAEGSKSEVDVIRMMREVLPIARFVVLSDELSTAKLAQAFEFDADGYLLRNISPEALIQSLNLVMVGENVFPTNLARLLVEGRLNAYHEESFAGAGHLSQRETQVLRCLVSGDPNKVIATRLEITEATVKVHIKSLLRKVHAANRTQAAIWGIEHGFPKHSIAAGPSA